MVIYERWYRDLSNVVSHAHFYIIRVFQNQTLTTPHLLKWNFETFFWVTNIYLEYSLEVTKELQVFKFGFDFYQTTYVRYALCKGGLPHPVYTRKVLVRGVLGIYPFDMMNFQE